MATAVSTKPWFLHGLEGPEFTIVEKKNGYETRQYAPSRWVATTVADRSWGSATRTGFWALFRYISGTNSARQKIPMTAPVATKIETPSSSAEAANLTVSFYVPQEFATNTPQPTEEGVMLMDLPAMTVYVIEFGGFPNDRAFAKHMGKLKDLLHEDKKDYVKDFYYAAGYDSPFRLFNRHNEVWFVSA